MAEKKVNKETLELLDRIEKVESSGMAITRQWYDIWSEGLRYFFSDHDYKLRDKDDWDWIVMNYIWPCAIQEIAKLAKNYPKILALPFNTDDETEIDAAEVWQGACQWQWQENLKMRLNQIAAIFCGKIYGYRVSKLYWDNKCYWDDENKRWMGDIKYKLWNPAFFWADGDETIDDGNCGTVRWVELKWAQSQWPAFKEELEAASISMKDAESSDENTNFKSWMSSTTLKQSENETGQNPEINKILTLIRGDYANKPENISSDTKFVRISDTYLKDYSESRQKEEVNLTPQELEKSGQVYTSSDQRLFDTNTNMPYTPEEWPKKTLREWDEPDYPWGRNILSAGEGESRFLLNPDNQRWPYKRWPFVVTPHYLLPFMWQGMNAVTLYKSTQDMVNISVTHLINNLKHFGDPKLAVEVGAIAPNPKSKDKSPYALKSAAGAIWQFARGCINKYKVEPPVPISPSALALFQLFSQDFKNLTGLQAVGKGEQLKSGTTATEATHLAISSNDRIYLQSVYEDEWCKELAKLMAEMMQANYDEGRWIRIVGESKAAGVQQITSKVKSVKYDITILPGTTLPFDEEKRIARYGMAYKMVGDPNPNPMLPDMLRILEIPNWQKIVKQIPILQKFQQFAQLYEAVKAGKIDPQQAVQLLVQAAVREFQAEQTGVQQ